MIASYIQELLATNNRVIVPNYGAFLVRATSKSKDATTLEEKLKDIYFSPFLKFNDELLEKFIIKKEGITKEQAAEKIKQFIDDIKKELDADKKYQIKDFGHFEADKQGKVQFITVAKETETPKETKAPTAKKPAATKKAAEKDEPKVEEKVEEKAKTEEQPKAEEIKTTTKEEPKKEPVNKLKEFKEEKKEEVVKKEEDKTTAPTQQKPIYSYKKEKQSVNKGLIWAIAIGVPLAIVFVWALLNFSTVKKVILKEKNKTEKIAKKKTTTKAKKPAAKKATETTQKESVKQEQKTQAKPAPKKQEVKPPPPQKKYYIIAGSFKNEKYADAFLNKLRAEGYNAEKLAERNGMHAVSYNSFADKRKAIAEYKFLAQEKGLQAWILYY